MFTENRPCASTGSVWITRPKLVNEWQLYGRIASCLNDRTKGEEESGLFLSALGHFRPGIQEIFHAKIQALTFVAITCTAYH